MKRMLSVIAAAATAALLVLFFFMPRFISQIQDMSIIGKMETSEAQNLRLEDSSDMSLIERMAMYAYNYNIIELQTGRYLTSETVEDTVIRELQRLKLCSLIGFDYGSSYMSYSTVQFKVDSTDPEKNLITWYINYIDAYDNVLTLVLDDETGVILCMQYHNMNYDNYSYGATNYAQTLFSSEQRNSLQSTLDPELIAQMFTEYWGLSMETFELAWHSGNYYEYTFEVSDGEDSYFVRIAIEGNSIFLY